MNDETVGYTIDPSCQKLIRRKKTAGCSERHMEFFNITHTLPLLSGVTLALEEEKQTVPSS